ncbi:MAG: quinolinate synthase NadA [Eubacteriales bacterium]|nr:quinolinate synthase NadA [Eubacteriales bacterium]
MDAKSDEIKKEINRLKKEKDAVILAHYYVANEVQDIADFIGDSYFLAQKATEVPQQTIVFCGVSFMGESAKMLNPDKKVIMPDMLANCPMAHMADADYIEKIRQEYDDLAVVCYINSTAELKKHSDVCVTSSNALKIVRALPNKNIFFIPDENLGRYIASLVPEKNFIFNDGFCHVHKDITKENVLKAMAEHPNARVLVHPECTLNVLELADYIGSTSGIIDYASGCDASEYIICTESGVLYELTMKNPDKHFYLASSDQLCPNMKKVTLEKVRDALINEANVVNVSNDVISRASLPLTRMLELAR